MEHLGSILSRLGKTSGSEKLAGCGSTARPSAQNTDSLPSPTLCPICKGAGWVRHRVPVGHPDFGEAFPCRCSKDATETKRAKQKAEWSNLPPAPGCSFENFETLIGTELALAAAQLFAAGGTPYHILVLTGKNGCGKTHLVEAIGRAMLADGRLVRYEYVPTMLDTLRQTYQEDVEVNFAKLWATYNRAEILILDDIGAEKPSAWAAEKVTALVEERYRSGKLLVAATNLTFDRMSEQIGPRIADRLWDDGTGKVSCVMMTSDSYRTGRSWRMRGARG